MAMGRVLKFRRPAEMLGAPVASFDRSRPGTLGRYSPALALRTAGRYIERYNELWSQASSWRAHWKDLARFISTRRARFVVSDKTRAGSKTNQAIHNNTGTRAKRILASGMMAGITSPARPWFRLRIDDFDLEHSRDVKIWLETVERRILEVFARSNVYNGLANVYDDLATFGTAALFVEEHPTDIMRVHVPPIGSYLLSLDQAYKVHSFYRKLPMTVWQMVQRFGFDQVSPATRAMYTRGQHDTWQEVLHVIEPNSGVVDGYADILGKPYLSIWIETGGPSGSRDVDHHDSARQRILDIGGFNEFPVMTPRWMVTGEDSYGNSPGMEALGDIRALQHMERRRMQALDKIVTPAMVGPAELANTRISLVSGQTTMIDLAAGGQKFEPAHIVDSRIAFLSEELARHEHRINSSFFADLFLMIAQQQGPQMTAREIEERHSEKMLQLGPVLERVQDELLDPLVNRTFGMLLRRGMIPEPPEEIQGRDARPEYISILAHAQKMLGLVAVEQLASFAAGLMNIDPQVADKLKSDRVMDEAADLMGTNPELLRTDDEVEQLREARSAMQDRLQAPDQAAAAKDTAQAAQALAGAAKDVDQSDTAQSLLRSYGSMAAASGGEA